MKKLLVLALVACLLPLQAFGETNPFLPTWKLMTDEQKQHFISGYLHAWRDAADVTGIAIGYIKDNPKKAVNSLDTIRGLYDVTGLRPQTLAAELDEFFAEPENKDSSLSKAVTYAKNTLR